MHVEQATGREEERTVEDYGKDDEERVRVTRTFGENGHL